MSLETMAPRPADPGFSLAPDTTFSSKTENGHPGKLCRGSCKVMEREREREKKLYFKFLSDGEAKRTVYLVSFLLSYETETFNENLVLPRGPPEMEA